MKKYLKLAYRYASQKGTDPSTQNAALLVDKQGKVVARGVNNFPSGVKRKPSRLVRPTKYLYSGHAERYAIFEAARRGIKTKGLTLYCPWASCADCARAIIQAGIKRVVAHKQIMENSYGRWSASIKVGLEMLKEAGVAYEMYDGKIGGVKIRFNSKLCEF